MVKIKPLLTKKECKQINADNIAISILNDDLLNQINSAPIGSVISYQDKTDRGAVTKKEIYNEIMKRLTSNDSIRVVKCNLEKDENDCLVLKIKVTQ